MTLEDFFTLTEMKDGLTALSRVEDLVTVMQKENDCSVKNVGDASREWIAVASTIAATENKDCLDLFIKLEGLWFIDKWLKDAQKFCTDTDESFLEESIITLLQALDKLHVNSEKSIASGVWITVKTLLGHKSSAVQDRARVLFDSWKKENDDGAISCEFEKASVPHGDQSSTFVSDENRPSASSVPTSEENLKGETVAVVPSEEVMMPSVSSERDDDVEISGQINQSSSPRISDSAEVKDRAEDTLASSIVPNSAHENPSPLEVSVSLLGEASVQTSFMAPQSGIVEEPKVNEFSKLEQQADRLEASVPSPAEPKATQSDIEVARSQDLMNQLTLQNNSEGIENDVHKKNSETDCAMESASDSKGVEGESREENRSNAAEDGECSSDALQESCVDVNMAGKPGDLAEANAIDGIGSDDEDKEDASDEDRDFRNAYEFSKPVMDSKRSDAINKRMSDVELDYGVDALEVARRVAKAVEREVGDFKGTFCSSSSSSEKTLEDGPKQPGSPDSINVKHDAASEVSTKEAAAGQIHSAEEDRTRISGRAPDSCNHNLDSSQVTEAAHEVDLNVEKGLCSFDLNEEVCSDEMDYHLINPVSTTISVVSASRPTTTPGFPVAPLQFEGTLGWRGSAATSAFRPTSSRRNSDSDKNPSVAGTSDGSSKQRQDWLDFDLNVAEGGGDDMVKQVPAFSGHPSGESSVEVSPKRSERFKLLDLNRIEDGGGDAPPSNSRMDLQHMYNRNGHNFQLHHHQHSPSPASSSSSMQPSLRNFDLNDRPYLNDPHPLDQASGGKSSQTVNAFLPPKPDSSVISILGTRVEINKRDPLPQSFSLSNGKATEPAVDPTMMGTGSFLGLAPSGSYTPSPVFGYNGLPTGPALSLPPALYGPPGGGIPYFMDSRTMAMPQIVPSASSVPPYSQPPFMMSMGNIQPSLNGAGPSRPATFDLNSGFMVDGGNRESGLRQFFVPGPGRPVEEQLRTNLQAAPSSSSLSGKRKEPDGGWEAFQFGYKQQQPPWR